MIGQCERRIEFYPKYFYRIGSRNELRTVLKVLQMPTFSDRPSFSFEGISDKSSFCPWPDYLFAFQTKLLLILLGSLSLGLNVL